MEISETAIFLYNHPLKRLFLRRYKAGPDERISISVGIILIVKGNSASTSLSVMEMIYGAVVVGLLYGLRVRDIFFF